MKNSRLQGVLLLPAHSERNGSPLSAADAAAIVIDGAQVGDGTGRPPIRDAVLVIRGARIEAVGPRGSVSAPKDAATIPAKGKTVIPGLINTHGHVGMTKGLKSARENYTRDNVVSQLKQYARYGVTTIMSLGTDFEPMSEIRGPARP